MPATVALQEPLFRQHPGNVGPIAVGQKVVGNRFARLEQEQRGLARRRRSEEQDQTGETANTHDVDPECEETARSSRWCSDLARLS